MKATGIIRRIDDLGRVAIPKEVRKALHWNNNDPLEFYIHNDTIVLKKYKMDSERLKDKCAKIVEKYRPIIKAISFAGDVTTVILSDGRTGAVKYNPADEFNLNVAITYALKAAGIQLEVEGL